jgi:hypothetical protein
LFSFMALNGMNMSEKGFYSMSAVKKNKSGRGACPRCLLSRPS